MLIKLYPKITRINIVRGRSIILIKWLWDLTGKVQNSHRAIDDCKALMEVAKAMDEERDDLDRYVNLFGFNPKYGPEKNQLKKVTYVPQDLWNCPPAKPTYETISGRN